MIWQILIATAAQRSDYLVSLLTENLLPQIDTWGQGAVAILALWDSGESGGLNEVRQQLVEGSRARYISFVDDDDRVSPNYVQRILPLLQPGDVDYVGWRMQAYIDGQPLKPTYHSLKFNGWWENQEGYYRHISHLNPIRRRLALEESFRSPHFPEDVGWALRLAAKNVVKTEAYIGDEPMYHYYSSTTSSLGQSPERVRPGNYVRPVIDSPYFRYHWKSSDGYTG